MGTKNSYTGGGGKAGKDLRMEIEDWLDSLPEPPEGESEPPDGPPEPDTPTIRPELLLPATTLFASRPSTHSDGPSGGGGVARSGGPGPAGGGSTRRGGGAQRSVAAASRTAGRAAAAAYALRTGNAGVLRDLGLDYESLRSNPDVVDVARQIMVAACGPLPDGTIEEEEQRVVAAQVAQWVLEENAEGAPPSPEEIVRETIAYVIFEAVNNETAAMVHDGRHPEWATAEAERRMRQTAQALALRVELSPEGPTPAEFSEAIAQGIETMRDIWGTS